MNELIGNYLDEQSSWWLYLKLGALNRDPFRSRLLNELAEFERRHAAIWERLLRGLGRPVPGWAPFREHRAIAFLARLFGVRAVIPILHKMEVEGIDRYKRQARDWQDAEARTAFEKILPDEVAHEIEFFQVLRKTSGLGGTLRSAILGANDGLGSILALAAGVAGATASSASVIIAGVAGLLAGAFSMAASNFVSVKAEQESLESQVRLQKEALAVSPGSKRSQVEAAYRRKGLSGEEARAFVERLSRNSDELLKVLLAEEYGIAEASFERPGRLALYTGAAFAAAGAVPLLPYFFLAAGPATLLSVALTGAALFLAGVVRSLATLRPFAKSGLEMVAVGLGSAVGTYLVGLALGVTIG